MTAKPTPTETPKGAWRITFLLFLFMVVNFADKAGRRSDHDRSQARA